MGDKFYVKDNRDTPDTMLATFRYPKFLTSYESRTCNPMPMFGTRAPQRPSTAPKATLVVNRSGCWVIPNRGRSWKPPAWEKNPEMSQMNVPHWQNFLECIKSRAEAHQRYRDLRAVVDHLHSGQPVDAIQDLAGLGREELDSEAGCGEAASEGALPHALEARGLSVPLKLQCDPRRLS